MANTINKLTIKTLLDMNPCSDGAKFLKEQKTIQKAWKTCSNPQWMIWALNRLNLFQESIAREFACECAEHTLHLFEDKYPDDKRPRKAIEFARTLIANPDAAESAAWSAAESAAWSAAESAARSAAESAAESAAWSAARSAEEQWQADKLRSLIDPFNNGGVK